MPEINGIEVDKKQSEKSTKVHAPTQSEEDPLKIFGQVRRKYGRKLTMQDIEELLADRYGA
jgi:hypothetical protein